MRLHPRLLGVCAALLAWAGSGCNPEAPPPISHGSGAVSLEQRAAAGDASVWVNEVLAQKHERIFVRLADAIRQAPDKSSVLARLPFDELRLPRRAGDEQLLDAGVRRQRFDGQQPLVLSPADWQKQLARFAAAGWNLRQVEWQHEKFIPPTNRQPAVSEFNFELDGEQPGPTNRFILRGTLQVTWSAADKINGEPRIGRLAVDGLTLLERAGPAGFDDHAVIAPEPDRADGQVNLHPLIVIDIDGDHHDDIVLPGVNKVLLNDGHANFRLTPFIREEEFYPNQGAGVVADFNGDGRLDFVTVADRGPLARMLVLHAGEDGLPWRSAAAAAWMQQRADFARYQLPAARVIAAGDVDGDGDLDLFVAQYRPPYVDGNLPAPYDDANDGYPAWLLLNDGAGHFSLGAPQPALAAKQMRRTLAASLVDVDGDGDLDLITLNDFSGVDLYYNDGHGNFSDETARLDEHHLFGMGLSVGDFNHEGALGILAIGMDAPTVRRLESMGLFPAAFPERTRQRGAMSWGNRLYLPRAGRWLEPPWAATLARTGWSWGVAAADFDNDGDLDLYVANGHVSGSSCADYDSHYWTHDIYLDQAGDARARQRYLDAGLQSLNQGRTSWNGYQHNVLFLDAGGHDYVNVAYLFGVAHETDCRAVATADLDEDGRPDLLVTEAIWQGTPNRMRHRLLIHLNQLDTRGHHWIGVRVPPAANGKSSIGSKVFARAGSWLQMAPILAGESFQTQMPATVHFGLGTNPVVDELKVVWADGSTNTLTTPAADRYHWIAR